MLVFKKRLKNVEKSLFIRIKTAFEKKKQFLEH